MRNDILIDILINIFFFVADWQNGDIVFIDAFTNLWVCCYQDLGANRNCSSTYSGPIVLLAP